jgi:hypothetical protein
VAPIRPGLEVQAVVFGPPAPVRRVVHRDRPGGRPARPDISLIRILICDGQRREHIFLCADSKREKKENLVALGELVRATASLPAISWAGTLADLPQLQAASERHRLGQRARPVVGRHVDLFMHAARRGRWVLRREQDERDRRRAAQVRPLPPTRSRSEQQQLQQELLAHNREEDRC